MKYEKPELIDLSDQAEHGRGQQKGCSVGSGAGGICKDGQTAGVWCEFGSGGGAPPP